MAVIQYIIPLFCHYSLGLRTVLATWNGIEIAICQAQLPDYEWTSVNQTTEEHKLYIITLANA